MVRDYAPPINSKKKVKIRFPLMSANRTRKNRRVSDPKPTGITSKKAPLSERSPFLRKWNSLSLRKKLATTLMVPLSVAAVKYGVDQYALRHIQSPASPPSYYAVQHLPAEHIIPRYGVKVTNEEIDLWKRMVAGEVALSLMPKGQKLEDLSAHKKEVAIKVAETVLARKLRPGWKNKSIKEILLQPEAYDTFKYEKFKKEIAFQPEAMELASWAVYDVLKNGLSENPPTHFYMQRKYALDNKGRVIYLNKNTPRKSTKKPPFWANKKKPSYVVEYPDEKRYKGPIITRFYTFDR